MYHAALTSAPPTLAKRPVLNTRFAGGLKRPHRAPLAPRNRQIPRSPDVAGAFDPLYGAGRRPEILPVSARCRLPAFVCRRHTV